MFAIQRGKEASERKLVRVEVRIERRFSSRRRQSASINYHAENEITRRRCSESHVHVTIHAPCDDATPPNDVTRREVTMRPSSETPSDTCSVIFLSSRNDAAHHPLNGLEFSKKRAPDDRTPYGDPFTLFERVPPPIEWEGSVVFGEGTIATGS